MNTISRQLFESIGRMMHLSRCLSDASRPRPPFGPGGYAQDRALRAVADNEGVTPRDLVELLDARPSSLSELLSKLEAADFIERRPNEQDRRQVNLYLKDAGRRRAEQLAEGPEPFDPFSALSEEEKLTYLSLTGKVIDELTRRCEELGVNTHPPRPPFGAPHGRPPMPPFGRPPHPGEMPPHAMPPHGMPPRPPRGTEGHPVPLGEEPHLI